MLTRGKSDAAHAVDRRDFTSEQGDDELTRLKRIPAVLLATATLGAVFLGFRTFWFLTDDAFIAFRYASNVLMGRGLVWNPAPFAPVEGYTSFLWTGLLALIWKMTGLTPPEVANWLSLACGIGTLWLVAQLALNMRLPARAEALRVPLLLLTLLGTLTNRTFLTWLSSGLETALVNLLITLWIWAALRNQPRYAWWLSSAAMLLALTRPDGLLFVAATPFLLALRAWSSRHPFAARSLAPLCVVPIHLAWRVQNYGEWLPNTYFAKHVAPWPEAGLRYAASFLLEYGFWLWILLLLAFIFAQRRTLHPPHLLLQMRPHVTLAAVVATLAVHVGYYTLIIGGDHFEFRVYSQLIPWLFLSTTWLAAWTFTPTKFVMGAVTLCLAMSWPIPWTHWLLTKDLKERTITRKMVVPVSDSLPFFMQPMARSWDALQAWLIPRHICSRHQEHKVFWQVRARVTPLRADGARIAWTDRPIMAAQSVGILAWRLPNVAIIDLWGLNDRVIARTPVDPRLERSMAHDRSPPPDYVACFRPNVFFEEQGIRVARRNAPLIDQEIVDCERHFARHASVGSGTPPRVAIVDETRPSQ